LNQRTSRGFEEMPLRQEKAHGGITRHDSRRSVRRQLDEFVHEPRPLLDELILIIGV
jgi:hypothetical protein